MSDQPRENFAITFHTHEDATAFRKKVARLGLRWGRPICWHDNSLSFPKEVVGASCFFLRFQFGLIGVTAAHVVRHFQRALAHCPSLVCQLHLMPFNLDSALIDISDDLDLATFSFSEHALSSSVSLALDMSSPWSPEQVIKLGAPIQLIGYLDKARIIQSFDGSAIFNAYGAMGVVEDFTERDIIFAYNPEEAINAPMKPPLGLNMSGCSGGPAIIHGTRNGLHRWYPVGTIIAGPKKSAGEGIDFDIIRVRRIDCIDPIDGHIRVADSGWLPS
jgi:hypothetical protein